jgi:hypothetical protein
VRRRQKLKGVSDLAGKLLTVKGSMIDSEESKGGSPQDYLEGRISEIAAGSKEQRPNEATHRSLQLSVHSCLGRVARFDLAARLPLR